MIDKLINVETGEVISVMTTEVHSYNFNTGSPFGQDRVIVYGYSSKNKWLKIELDSKWVPLDLFNPEEHTKNNEDLQPFGRTRLNLLCNSEDYDDAPRGFIETFGNE